jgi:hypothetical protein
MGDPYAVPNFLAYAMIVMWPILAMIIAKKRSDSDAAILLFLVPYLLLPVKTEIDFPVLPPIDKQTIVSLVAFYFFYVKKKTLVLMPGGFYRVLIIFLFLSPIATCLTNGEALYYGSVRIPSLGITELLNMLFSVFAKYYVPFVIGYCYVQTSDSQKNFVKYILIAGLIYSVPMLWEVRMSPQLHAQIYGFFPHDFSQSRRQGGFRPVVFLGHGLLVAIFAAFVLVAAVANWKEKLMEKRPKLVLGYVLVLLFLCKSWGPLLLGLLGALLLIVVPRGIFKKTLLVVSIAAFIYPMLRMEDIVPTKNITEFFGKYSEERAHSLQFRFDNEELLLAKAAEKPLFGWGIWGRSRVFDPKTGKDIAISDGFWVIIFGVFGWLGYLTVFGLLCLPLIQYALRHRDVSESGNISMLPYIATMLMINIIDLLPNSSNSQITFLMAGIIAGNLVQANVSKAKVREYGGI